MIRSRERDESMERLLRQSIDAPQDSGVTDACLDAEAFAAMIDGGLSGPALAAAQSHVADCGRCQRLVGAVARVDSFTPAVEHRQPARWWLAWAVPVAAAAAAVALWVAVPGRLDTPLRQGTERPAPQITEGSRQAEPAAPAPQVAGRLEAPANETDGARPKESLAAGDAKKTEQGFAGQSRRDAAPSSVENLKVESAPSTGGALAPAEEPAPTAAQATAPSPRADAAQAAAPSPGSRTALESTAALSRLAETVGVDIVSPDTKVRWRIAGSTVQSSADGGANWETQSSGNVAELTAGVAPSASVCSIVGRAGVVLLSIDGRTWRRVAFPETADLSAVRATDARSASVSTIDGRTFSTTDAGATWVAR